MSDAKFSRIQYDKHLVQEKWHNRLNMDMLKWVKYYQMGSTETFFNIVAFGSLHKYICLAKLVYKKNGSFLGMGII